MIPSRGAGVETEVPFGRGGGFREWKGDAGCKLSFFGLGPSLAVGSYHAGQGEISEG